MVHLSGWLCLIILTLTMLVDTEKETVYGSVGQQRPFRCKGWVRVVHRRQKQAKNKKTNTYSAIRVAEEECVKIYLCLERALWPSSGLRRSLRRQKCQGKLRKKEKGETLWSVYPPWWWIEMEYPPLCPDPSAHTSPSLSTLLLMQSLGFAAVCPFFDAGPFL